MSGKKITESAVELFTRANGDVIRRYKKSL